MEIITAFWVAVAAGVACHYIIKWLYGGHKDNKYPTGCFSSIKEKKNPRTVRQYSSGIHSFVHMDLSLLFVCRHYSICKF